MSKKYIFINVIFIMGFSLLRTRSVRNKKSPAMRGRPSVFYGN